MDFAEVLKKRRSVRVFTSKKISEQDIAQCIDLAFLAPNSSNIQTTRIYRVSSPDKRASLVSACLNQSAARTAAELFVIVAEPQEWRLGRDEVLRFFGSSADPKIKSYYSKLIPFLYSYRFLAPVKFLMFNLMGIFKPTPRRPWSGRDIDEVCIKSAALVSENLMLSLVNFGYDSCPLEGFDESRVKSILNLKFSSRVVMIVAAGERDAQGIWGEQFRINSKWTYFNI